MTEDSEPIQHGTRAGYERQRCRCEACRAWRAEYRRSMVGRPCPRCERPRNTTGYCDECSSAMLTSWAKRTSDVAWLRRLKTRYGITPDEYAGMLADQEGRCAICRRPPQGRRLAVDHCHTTGQVRGLLCAPCNTTLGKIEDDPAIVERMVSYLKGFAPST